ncbi:ribbon-helix-helix domain-containing protein [Lentibacillus salinarum]|uniref:CopG family transcriptional regulator n=1 Tax=Lentibacillus salinarum TaxID=446820 RepID=A0ABW3ZRX9_9BACI
MEDEKKVRKQIYLNPEQNRQVKQISARNSMTEAEIIREAVDHYLANNQMKQKDPLLELVGMVKKGEKMDPRSMIRIFI